MCKWLIWLGKRIEEEIGFYGYWVFVDSVFVLEKVLVEKVGLGWIGKYMLLLDCSVGLWFFFGEIYIDLLLLVD